MRLSDFDEFRILCVDQRYEKEKDRLLDLFDDKGIWPCFFVDGGGSLLPRSKYNQIGCPPPPGWKDGFGSYNNFRAFKAMIAEARRQGVPSLLVAEDDVVLTPDFDEVVGRIRIPDDWDMIYYGANHTDARTQEVAPGVLRVFGSTMTHLVGFKDTIYDAILSLPEDKTMDWNIANRLHERFKCYAIYPPVAKQKPNYSTLWLREVNYDSVMISRGKPIEHVA